MTALFLSAFSVLVVNTITPPTAAVKALVVDGEVTASIKAPNVQSYSVMVEPGQTVLASLNQKGVDLYATVHLPNGQEQTFDTRWHGEERFALGLEGAGTYRIRIGVVADGPAFGDYTLKLSPIEGRDEEEAKANQARLLFTNVKKSLPNARRDAIAAATADSQRCLELWKESGDEIGQAQSLNALGYLRNYTGDRAGALDDFAKALEIWVRLGDLSGEAETRSNVAATLRAQGKREEAFEQEHLALALRRKSGDRGGEAMTLGNLANMDFRYGKYTEGVELSQAALRAYDTAGMRAQKVAVFSTLARWYDATGQYREATEVYRQALPLSAALDRRGYGYLLDSKGLMSDDLGDLDSALRDFRQAQAEAHQTGDPILEADCLNNIASAYLAKDQIPEAEAANEEIRRIPKIEESALVYWKYLLNKARIYERKGEFTSAEEVARSCAQRGKALDSVPLEAAALLLLGQIEFRREHYAEAIKLERQALDLWRQASDSNHAAFTLVSLASVERAMGRTDEALADVTSAVDLIEAARTTVTAQDLRASFLSSRYQHFKLWIDLLMESGQVENAFSASERARSRILLDLLREEKNEVQAGASPSQLAGISELTSNINGKAFAMSRLDHGKESALQRAALGKEMDTLVNRRRALEDDLRVTSPRYASFANSSTVSAAEVQSLLDDETALLEYSLDREHSYVWLVTRSSVRAIKLCGEGEIMNAVGALGRTLGKSQATAAGAAHRLGALITMPLMLPKNIRRLAIVAEGPLEGVPFAILPGADGRTLLRSVEIVRLPSASVLAELRREQKTRTPAPLGVFIVADPVFDKDDPRVTASSNGGAPDARRLRTGISRDSLARLYFSGEEARHIASEAGPKNAKLFYGFAARREVLWLPEARNYRIHHLATHLILDDRHPDLSRIVFSLLDKQQRPVDGYLRLHEIYNLDLPSELVVLSACKSGLGFPINGEGMIGFTRGMLLAGAKAVLASVWSVDDEATAELMRVFYHEMLHNHQPPAAALRLSQLRIMQQAKWRNPYYWAGFSLYGDWSR